MKENTLSYFDQDFTDVLEECVSHISYVKESMNIDSGAKVELTLSQKTRILDQVYQAINCLIDKIDCDEIVYFSNEELSRFIDSLKVERV